MWLAWTGSKYINIEPATMDGTVAVAQDLHCSTKWKEGWGGSSCEPRYAKCGSTDWLLAQYNGLHGCGAQLNIRLEIVSCDSERFTAIAVTADLDSYERRNDVIHTTHHWRGLTHVQPFPSVVATKLPHSPFTLLWASPDKWRRSFFHAHTSVHRSKIVKNHKSHSELQ